MKVTPRLKLDRMVIEEAGPDPQRLAAAIHAQLPELKGAVPVHQIAYGLDIVSIEERQIKSFEAALIAPEERGYGGILVNAASSRRRQRYSVAHELCHFLNPAHRPHSTIWSFACTQMDLSIVTPRRGHVSGQHARHLRQEAEANRFAIELLAPRHLVHPFLDEQPNLRNVVAMADALDLSREASARRYVGLHRDDTAVVFSRVGKVRYVQRSANFPQIVRRAEQLLGSVPPAVDPSGLSQCVAADHGDWLDGTAPAKLTIQTLHQQDGYAITMLSLARVPGVMCSSEGVRIRLLCAR